VLLGLGGSCRGLLLVLLLLVLLLLLLAVLLLLLAVLLLLLAVLLVLGSSMHESGDSRVEGVWHGVSNAGSLTHKMGSTATATWHFSPVAGLCILGLGHGADYSR
jgi:uncharacterized membrane protein